jgi:hypothetical protein
VNVVALGGQLANRRGSQLAVNAGGCQQLGAVGKELRRAALVRLHMRLVRADDAVIRLAQRRQRQRIGRGAIEDEVHLALRFKQAPEGISGFGRPRIVAIRRHVPAIRGFHRRPSLGTNSRIVVAGKLLVQILFCDFSHGASSFLQGKQLPRDCST